MAKLYSNGIVFQDGVQVKSALPIDDRLVLNSIEDLYFADNAGTLFNVAYTGMTVVVMDNGTPRLMILKDSTPYANNSGATIDATNYTDYWLEQTSVDATEQSLTWIMLDEQA